MKEHHESLKKLRSLLIAANSVSKHTAEPRVGQLLDEALAELDASIAKNGANELEVRRRAWEALDSFFKCIPKVATYLMFLSG